MRLGLFSINTAVCADPAVGVEVAQAAESAGFDSVWTAEHVVLPDPQAPPSPSHPLNPILDPAVALANISAHTKSIRLATGIIILPQRNPMVMAKEFASLDVISGGRVILGVAGGYLKAEFDALHVPFNDRGRRVEDAVAAMRAIWTQDEPSHEGPYWSFSGVQSRPRPLQQTIPIVFGGHTQPVYDRTVRMANGWYGFFRDVEATSACLAGLRQAAANHDRPRELGRIEISVTPPPKPLTPSEVERYGELGVDRLVVLPRGDATRDDLLRVIEQSVAAVRR